MTLDEAILLLHPDTTGEALWKYGTKEKCIEVIDKACIIACEAMKKVKEMENEVK